MSYVHDRGVILCCPSRSNFFRICHPQLTQQFFTMPGGFIKKEPTDSKKLRENPEVVELFTRAQWMSFCDKLQGYDDEVAEEFLRALKAKIKDISHRQFQGFESQTHPTVHQPSYRAPNGGTMGKRREEIRPIG